MTKGLETKDRILDRAFRIAGRDGLGGLTLSTLATGLGMSKSGLFAHFRSKEELQLQVLETATARFQEAVIAPAVKAPRGLPRLRKLFDGWLRWMSDPALPGGCIFVAAAVELDDRDGKPRDFLVAAQRQLRETIARIARTAVDTQELRRDLDCEQLAFEIYAIILGYNHDKRLLREDRPEARARAAFARLLADAS
ncbi:MAG TPA: TetR/AcrR family transcriptional regulator [Kofleriaceae bacterium]|jgi:AcrR family transcriptional regulator